MADDWPWDQDPDCGVFTCRSIIERGRPILFVSHDSDDHGWQFLDGGDADLEDAMLVCLSHIAQLDPSVVQLASMAPGYIAWRETADAPWVIDRNTRADEEEEETAIAKDIVVPNFQYKCTQCEDLHTGFPVVRFLRPEVCLAIPKEKRSSREEITDNVCILDGEHHFVRCDLEIPVIGTRETLTLSVWGTLSEANFRLYELHRDDSDRARLGPFFSWLSSRLDTDEYPDTLNLACRMLIREPGKHPLLVVQSEDHHLARDQQNGIPFAKALRIVQPFITWHSGGVT